jgi:catechol 2,3-dioxygenase-like lactoylglutathione lyase family enzyme
MFREVHPVLPCRDVASAIEFYVGKLGFTLRFQDASDPRYAGVRRDDVELHLQWHDSKEWAQVERPMLRFLVADVDTLHDELRSKGVFHQHTALRDTPWGTREFAFFDLNQNGLTFYRNLDAT